MGDTQWYVGMAKKLRATSDEIKTEIHVWKLKHDPGYKLMLILTICSAFVIPRFIKNKPNKYK